MSSRSPRGSSRSPVRRRSPSKSPRRSVSPRRTTRSPKRSPSPKREPRRSHSRDRKYSRSHSRDRKYSRSPSPRRDRGRRGDREDEPAPESKVVGIFGLSSSTREADLREAFEKYGELENVVIIYDRRTGESKRFGFVYFVNQDDAVKAKEGLSGLVLHGNEVRIDFSKTRRAYSPTPGRYMGKRQNDRRNDRWGPYNRNRGYDRYSNRSRGYDRYDRGYDRYDRDRDYDRDRRSYDRRSYDRRSYDRKSYDSRSRSPRRM